MTTRVQLIVGYGLLAAVIALVAAGWQLGAFAVVDDNLNRRYRVEGAAMQPNLCNGDVVAFHKPDQPFERFEIIMFRFHLGDPAQDERLFIKRVIGLPNETIEVRDGVILIDGMPLEGDTYALATPTYTFEPMTIPPDRYFVLGDNRRNSYDSHQWAASALPEQRETAATVPEESIRGELPPDTHKC